MTPDRDGRNSKREPVVRLSEIREPTILRGCAELRPSFKPNFLDYDYMPSDQNKVDIGHVLAGRLTLPPLVLDLTPPPALEPVRVAVRTDVVTVEALVALGWSDSQAAAIYQTNLQLGGAQT